MIVQLALGTALILASVLIAGLGFWVLEDVLLRLTPWLKRRPHRPKMLAILCGSVVWITAIVTVSVWLWAMTLWAIGIFPEIEASTYFALVAFTTLGFGDVLLPVNWQLLSGMAAMNGLLHMGLLTAMLIEVLRRVRIGQLEGDQSQS